MDITDQGSNSLSVQRPNRRGKAVNGNFDCGRR